MKIPRAEYPRPQFVRKDWLCLNGEWQFEIDYDNNGLERGLRDRELGGAITVPFCPESEMSGIAHTRFMDAVWYRRTVKIPEDWSGRRVLLHFQACDYDTTVWVNGAEAGRHRGGFAPFTCDISDLARPGNEALIVVRARDIALGVSKPYGKQSNHAAENAHCHYTRTTGIWQTVWMEPVSPTWLKRARITPDVASGRFRLVQPISGNARGMKVRAILSNASGEKARAEVAADRDFAPMLDLKIEGEPRLWDPDDPHLYDLVIELVDGDGQTVDRVSSYAGLRSVTIDGRNVRINGRKVFQRLVLDQGYYPDGIMTAPSDEALITDIRLSMAAGFNGARLHQKVFEERFLYHADRLGYLCWGEFADCGENHDRPAPTGITQWLEVLERDYSHPAIIGWCGLNESWRDLTDEISSLSDFTIGMYLAAKAMDSSRPVLDISGHAHRMPGADVYDSHDYTQDIATFAENHSGLADGKPLVNPNGDSPQISLPYAGQPYFVSEFGGILWNPRAKPGENSVGYGEPPKTIEEFYERFEGLCSVLLSNPDMFGYCYTQLTDVFQEQNGIYYFSRDCKFDMEKIRSIQTRVAAFEKEG